MIPRSKASFQNETTTRRPEVVSIFAKMSKYIDWIEKNMKPCPIAYMYLHVLNPNLPYITIHLPYQTFPTFLWTSLDWFLLNKGGTCISSATRCSSRRKARTSGRAVRVGRDHVFPKACTNACFFFRGMRRVDNDGRMEELIFWGSMDKLWKKKWYCLLAYVPSFWKCLSASTLLADLSQLPNTTQPHRRFA